MLEAAIKSTMENPVKFTSSKSVSLPIKIVPPGSNLLVRPQGVSSLVVDQAIDEGLLGRPFLKAIGFDSKSHLERVGKLFDGKHVNEFNPSTI